MDRRVFLSSVAALAGSSAAAASMPSEGNGGSDAHQGSIVNVIDFGSRNDASRSFYLAMLYLNKRGGGSIRVPQGVYNFQESVKVRIGCKISIITDPNAILVMNGDDDLFNITGSKNAAFRFYGSGELAYSGVGKKDNAAIRFISKKENGDVASSSFCISGRIRIRKGTSSWAYGLHLTDVRDGVIDGIQIDGLNTKESESNSAGIFITSKESPSISWNITNCQVNDCRYGIMAVCDSVPGVEGIKIFNCDFVGVRSGIVYHNKTTYFPPQIEIAGCHINSYGGCIVLKNVISVHIYGGLFYRYSSNHFNEPFFLNFDTVSDVSIVGPSFSIIDNETDAYGIKIFGGKKSSSYYRISDCHFWANSKKSSFVDLSGIIGDLSISCCTKDSNGPWFSLSDEVKMKSISFDRDTIKLNKKDKGVMWGRNAVDHDGIIDLSNVTTMINFIEAKNIKSIQGGFDGEEYKLVVNGDIKIPPLGNVVVSGDGLYKAGEIISIFKNGDQYYLS